MENERDRFWVDCPGCDQPVGSFLTAMVRAGGSCDCGTNFRVDVEERTAEEIEVSDGDPQADGHR